MIELAVALDLAEHGFGTYGETIFVNESPILDTGAVSSKDGIWITSTTVRNGNGHYPDQLTVSNGNGHYTDQLTVSTRFYDVIRQGEYLLKLMEYINTQLVDQCTLSCQPESPIVYKKLNISPASSIDLDAVDNEGHYVKSIHFTITYPLPDLSGVKVIN